MAGNHKTGLTLTFCQHRLAVKHQTLKAAIRMDLLSTLDANKAFTKLVAALAVNNAQPASLIMESIAQNLPPMVVGLGTHGNLAINYLV